MRRRSDAARILRRIRNRTPGRHVEARINRHVKLSLLAAAMCILPLWIVVRREWVLQAAGEGTRYFYLDWAAVIGGIGAIWIGVVLFRSERRPRWAIAVTAVVLVLGAFQVVRGTGVLPTLTGCVSDSGSLGFCTPSEIVS